MLWNPPVQGKRYVRELQAIAQSAAGPQGQGTDGAIEAGGFLMSAETAASVRAIDLRARVPRVRERALLVERDDMGEDDALARHLDAAGIPTERLRAPGWVAMMAEHQFTVVPEAALDAITRWVSAEPHRMTGRPGVAATMAPRVALDGGLQEEACRFGEAVSLFGILARQDGDPSRRAVLMFNAGSVHHVGPNRGYVALARTLAAKGLACLRFDLEGIGDSVLRGPGRENHPYPEHSVRDARAAIDHLKRAHGYRRFIALGLCSGANTAFHAGLADVGKDIEEVVLVNPLIYYYEEGMSLEIVDFFADAQAYRQSMRDPRRWMKLARGDVNFRRLGQVMMARLATATRSAAAAAIEALVPSRAPRLARDLATLAAERRVTVFLSEHDAARDILMDGARRTVARGVRSGRIRLEAIAGADHTFSRSAPREEMIRRVARTLG